jgi:hypothetical protein
MNLTQKNQNVLTGIPSTDPPLSPPHSLSHIVLEYFTCRGNLLFHFISTFKTTLSIYHLPGHTLSLSLSLSLTHTHTHTYTSHHSLTRGTQHHFMTRHAIEEKFLSCLSVNAVGLQVALSALLVAFHFSINRHNQTYERAHTHTCN